MAKISWKSPIDGQWTDATRWSTGKIPGAADDAALGFVDSYTVRVSTAVTVHSISITNLGALLDVAAAGKIVNVSGLVFNYGEIAIDAAGSGGTTLTIGGTLTNRGVLDIGNSGIVHATTVSAAALANTGSILLDGGAIAAATLKIGHAAPSTLTGFVSLQGDALLQFASGQVTSIAAASELVLHGPNAHVAVTGKTTSNSALTTLTRNAGMLDLEDRASVTTAGKFTNAGTLELDAGNFNIGGSRLKIGGTLTNNGTIKIGRSDHGPFTTQMTIAGLVNDIGSISMNGSAAPAVLLVNTTAPQTLTGTINLSGWSVLEFAGGGVTSIAADTHVKLSGPRALIALGSNPTSNSALSNLTTIAGSLEIDNGVLHIGKTLTVSGTSTSALLTLSDSTISGGMLAKTNRSSITLEGTCRLSNLTIAAGTPVVGQGFSNLPLNLIVDHLVVDGTLSTPSSNAQLTFALPGVDNMTNISRFTTINLADGGANSIIVTQANFPLVGNDTINGGNSGNTIKVTALSPLNHVTVNGGAKADTLIAGPTTTMTGGGGADQFVFANPGTTSPPGIDIVTDFIHLVDKIVFKDAGFGLGIDEGKGTAAPQAIAPALFSPHTDGTFATAGNRFAYNGTTGQLFYDADGSGSTHSSQLVASLTGHPTVNAQDLFFTS